MDKSPYMSPIAGQMYQLEQNHAWTAAAQQEMSARARVRRLDSEGDGIDLKDPDHVGVQLDWARARASEADARQNLYEAIVDPDWDDLDAIGKTALLTSIELLDTQSQPVALFRKHESSSGRLILTMPRHHGRRPQKVALSRSDAPDGVSGLDRVFWQADMIDESIRTVDDLLSDGSEITVHETHHWRERRQGRRVPFNDSTSVMAVVEDRSQSFALTGPWLDEADGGLHLGLPTAVTGAKITSLSGDTSRWPASDDTLKMNSRLEFPPRQDGVVNVPLVPIMHAAGQDVERYVAGDAEFFPGEKHTMTIIVGDTQLIMPSAGH